MISAEVQIGGTKKVRKRVLVATFLFLTSAEHWLEEELRQDVERPDDARIPIARLACGINHGPKLWPGHQEFILLWQIVRQPRQQEFYIGVDASRLGRARS
jgi:hypothetical protein